jgi:hypothetical protein
MAIQTTLQPKYSIRIVAIFVICLVFGLWGIYDYVWVIPGKMRVFERYQACLQTGDALQAEPGSSSALEKIDTARATVEAELKKLLDLGMTEEDGQAVSAEQAIESVKARNEENWLAVLLLFKAALAEAEQRTAGATPSEGFVLAVDVARRGVTATGDITPPGEFDRAVQWLFILCLPTAPYFLWILLKTKKRVYRLDDDGTFSAPGATWAPDEIADIDMSRWMAKSIAFVVHTDGTRIKLDDYIFRNTHLIVGALACERYPEQWDERAKPVRKEEPAEEEWDEEGLEDEHEAGPEDAAEAEADEERAEPEA